MTILHSPITTRSLIQFHSQILQLGIRKKKKQRMKRLTEISPSYICLMLNVSFPHFPRRRSKSAANFRFCAPKKRTFKCFFSFHIRFCALFIIYLMIKMIVKKVTDFFQCLATKYSNFKFCTLMSELEQNVCSNFLKYQLQIICKRFIPF